MSAKPIVMYQLADGTLTDTRPAEWGPPTSPSEKAPQAEGPSSGVVDQTASDLKQYMADCVANGVLPDDNVIKRLVAEAVAAAASPAPDRDGRRPAGQENAPPNESDAASRTTAKKKSKKMKGAAAAVLKERRKLDPLELKILDLEESTANMKRKIGEYQNESKKLYAEHKAKVKEMEAIEEHLALFAEWKDDVLEERARKRDDIEKLREDLKWLKDLKASKEYENAHAKQEMQRATDFLEEVRFETRRNQTQLDHEQFSIGDLEKKKAELTAKYNAERLKATTVMQQRDHIMAQQIEIATKTEQIERVIKKYQARNAKMYLHLSERVMEHFNFKESDDVYNAVEAPPLSHLLRLKEDHDRFQKELMKEQQREEAKVLERDREEQEYQHKHFREDYEVGLKHHSAYSKYQQQQYDFYFKRNQELGGRDWHDRQHFEFGDPGIMQLDPYDKQRMKMLRRGVRGYDDLLMDERQYRADVLNYGLDRRRSRSSSSSRSSRPSASASASPSASGSGSSYNS